MATRAALPFVPAALTDIFAVRGWLSGHPAAFRTALLALAVPVHVGTGLYVYREGSESHGLYGVVSGGIGVEGGHPRQSPRLGHVHRAGAWFGLRAPFNGGPRALSYRALEPSRLVFVPNSRLLPLMQADAGIAIRVGQLGEEGSRLASWIVRDLLTRDAGQRVAAVLLRVLGNGELVPDNPNGFRLTQQMLGEMANLSRNHVCRKLGEFEAAGWISWGYNHIRLLDAGALAAFAYGDEAA